MMTVGDEPTRKDCEELLHRIQVNILQNLKTCCTMSSL